MIRPYLSTVTLTALTVSVLYGSPLEPLALTEVREGKLYEPTTTCVSARSINGFCDVPSGTVNVIRPAPPVNCLVAILPTDVRVNNPREVRPARLVSSSSRG